jgi:MFS family permease
MSQYTHQRAASQYAQEPGCQPVARPAGGHAWRVTLPRVAGVWLVAVVFFLLFFAAAAPSPLYGVYQARWRFSATTLTAVFAAYALLLLVALLVFGSVSDYLGRRRVILAGLALAAGACALFLAANGVGMLLAARALQGAAVGTASSALGASLIDLQPEGSGRAPVITTTASLLGLAAGGLGTSALVQYGPAPARLVWWLLLGAFLAAGAAVLAMPETAPPRPGVLTSLRPRVAVPRRARGTFAVALPCLIAVWMLSGFYLSLGPSLAAQVLRSPDLLWGGLVIFLLAGIGAAGPVVFRKAPGPAAMLAGCLVLLAGAVVTLAAIETSSAVTFLTGTAVAGAGFGTAMLGAFRTVSAVAAPGQRASLIAAYFIASYLAFSIPVVAAGVATTHVGLHRTALAYCAALAVLAALAAGSLIFRGRSRAPGTRSTGRAGRPVQARGTPAGGNGPAEPRRNAMATSLSTPAVSQNDHVAAAAYLMKHAGATALVVLDGLWSGRPVGIVTKAGIAQAAAAGEDLNNIRIRDLMPSAGDRARDEGRSHRRPSGAR